MILVISSKKVYAAKRLKKEAAIANCGLRIMDMQDLVNCNFKIDLKKFDVLYIRDPYLKGNAEYLPQIIKLAKRFKAAGKKVVDSAIADGELGQGKWADYQQLQKADLPIPKTHLLSGYLLPPTRLDSAARLVFARAKRVEPRRTSYPLVLKWTYGFKAKNVFLIKNQEQLKKILPLHSKKEWLVQEFIQADYEYKVITVGYKALPIILRFKIKDGGFRTDFSSHSVILNPKCYSRGEESLYKDEILRSAQDDAIKEVAKLAESASRLLKRELAKVDILEVKGKFYILEVNRFPGLKSFEELTKFNVVKAFLGYLQK